MNRAQVLAALEEALAPRPLVRSKSTRRWLLTVAQDETPVYEAFWANLHAFAEHLSAEVLVAGCTYQKGLFEDHAVRTGFFCDAVQPFLVHERVELGPVLFLAELNILPTAVDPMSGMQAYSRGRPAAFPHNKLQLESVATIPGRDVPILATTGSCTIPNFVQKKAGQKAQFHHVTGALLVEVDADGDWFMRHVNASSDGTFQDLDVLVRDGVVTTGHRVEAITWGDIHRETLDPVAAMTAWGFDVHLNRRVADGMLDALRPAHQFFHDLLDFRARNHHNRHDPHHAYRQFIGDTECIETSVRDCVTFLRETQRPWCNSAIVESNHDRALGRWLKETDWRDDIANARCHLRWNTATLEAIRAGDADFNVFRHVLAEADDKDLAGLTFIPVDGSYRTAGGVEHGMHGDFGLNGGKGNIKTFTKLSTKVDVGHSHTAGIRDAVYQAGTNCQLRQNYTAGPSSWTASDIVNYPSGKRCVVTKRGSKWRAA